MKTTLPNLSGKTLTQSDLEQKEHKQTAKENSLFSKSMQESSQNRVASSAIHKVLSGKCSQTLSLKEIERYSHLESGDKKALSNISACFSNTVNKEKSAHSTAHFFCQSDSSSKTNTWMVCPDLQESIDAVKIVEITKAFSAELSDDEKLLKDFLINQHKSTPRFDTKKKPIVVDPCIFEAIKRILNNYLSQSIAHKNLAFMHYDSQFTLDKFKILNRYTSILAYLPLGSKTLQYVPSYEIYPKHF